MIEYIAEHWDIMLLVVANAAGLTLLVRNIFLIGALQVEIKKRADAVRAATPAGHTVRFETPPPAVRFGKLVAYSVAAAIVTASLIVIYEDAMATSAFFIFLAPALAICLLLVMSTQTIARLTAQRDSAML